MDSEEVVRIEEFQFHLGLGELRHSSRPVPLEPRAAQVLAYLARNAGRVVSRAELLAAVWPRGEGSDGALSYSVRRLRQALGARGRAAISTFRRQGYRLHAELAQDSGDWDALEPHDLIERKAALTHLRAQFKSCSGRKQPALAIVTGMAGSGKTALLQGFRRELEQSGERALFTHASELPAREQLDRLAGRRALVVFVEDIHEAGAGAIESLRSAATQGTRPIFFVATCRTPLSASRVQCLGELLRSARTFALDLLSESGARRLLRTVCGSPPHPALEQRLVHLGGGNPLFLRELSTAQAQAAMLDTSALFVAPSALSEALRRHLSELPESAFELLRYACVIGQEFDARLLLRERHRRVRDVVMALEPAISQQIVQPLSEYKFRFTHPLFHEYLQSQLTCLQRREWDWAIAVAVERLGNADTDRPLPRLAFQSAQGSHCQEPAARATRVRNHSVETGDITE